MPTLTDEDREALAAVEDEEVFEPEGEEKDTPDSEDEGGEPGSEDEGGGEVVVLTKDGKHQIPFKILETTRQENRELKDRLAKLEARVEGGGGRGGAKPDEDPYAELRAMKPDELAEYADLGSEEHSKVLEFIEVRAVERARKSVQDELTQKEQRSAAQKVAAFVKEHAFMSDPMWRGAAEAIFDAEVGKGVDVETALETVKARITEAQGGTPEGTIQRNLKPGQRVRSLSGAGSPARGGGSGSPVLDRVGATATEAYRKLTPEQKRNWLRTGRV